MSKSCLVAVVEVERSKNRAYVARSVYSEHPEDLDPLEDWTNSYMPLDAIEGILGYKLLDGRCDPYPEFKIPIEFDAKFYITFEE